jgi:multicomponent Na+:H+ antiporter subunit B
MVSFVIAVLLTLLAVVTVAVIRQRSMFGVVILAGIYSFLMASVLVALDAVDVAMTEASVGAGISTIVFLATLHLTNTRENPRPRNVMLPLFVSGVVGAALIWGTFTLPPFGIADAPIHMHTVPHYLQQSIRETGVPNIVTAVLADYRSFDTLGEVTVIFTGGIGVMLLLKGRRRRQDRNGGISGT